MLHSIEPREPIKVELFTLQGLFIKRQPEVAGHFADIISEKVLAADNSIRHISEGPSREPVMAIFEEQVEKSLKVYERDTLVSMLVSEEKLAEAKEDVCERVRNADLSSGDPVRAFADQGHRINEQIHANLSKLDSDEFGGVLRPVFQQDEWKPILAGGVIGVVIGCLQVPYLFGGF